MTTSHLLLGFDARELWLADPYKLRTDDSMLRTDVERPYSTDPSVWQTVFKGRGRLRRAPSEREVFLWEKLAYLRSHLKKAIREPPKPFCLIAIALATASCEDEKELACWQSKTPPTVPTEIDASWRFLGYDVSDYGRQSGLSWYGYPDEDELRADRRTWGPLLNAHHLFDDLAPALEFQPSVDKRVEEHTFFTFGLWLVDEFRPA